MFGKKSDEEMPELTTEELEAQEKREAEEEQREEQEDGGLRVPPGDQFALGAELTDLESKNLDKNIFNKDIPTGNLTLWQQMRIQDAIENIELARGFSNDIDSKNNSWIRFLLVEIHAISATSKANKGWLLETLYSQILKKETTRIDATKPFMPQQQPQQQQQGRFGGFGK